jgi:hypothetical protein
MRSMEPAADIGVFMPGTGILAGKIMDQKAGQASESQRKTVVILSDRSREIIRLFEERRQKRLQAEQSRQMQLSNVFRPSTPKPS